MADPEEVAYDRGEADAEGIMEDGIMDAEEYVAARARFGDAEYLRGFIEQLNTDPNINIAESRDAVRDWYYAQPSIVAAHNADNANHVNVGGNWMSVLAAIQHHGFTANMPEDPALHQAYYMEMLRRQNESLGLQAQGELPEAPREEPLD